MPFLNVCFVAVPNVCVQASHYNCPERVVLVCPQTTPELVDVLNRFDLPCAQLEFAFEEMYNATNMHNAVSSLCVCVRVCACVRACTVVICWVLTGVAVLGR